VVRIDLHTHSAMSDGTEAPAQVMRAAAAAGLDVVALTDHDTLAGWDEAEAEARALGLRFVPGIEISSRHRGVSVHLLAYWPRVDDADLLAMMARTRDARVDRAREIVARVARDYPITWEAVSSHSESAETIGRPHIADTLVAAGIVADRDAAFSGILHDGSPYYVPYYAPDVLDVVRAVRAAGGVAAFAHPGADGRGRVVPTSVIEAMARVGLVGLEVEHRDHSEGQRERLARLAERLGLVPLGASDYHGAGKPNRLGENLTSPEALAALEAARS
jgi:predicted metal-dependent phosphoesterase TrpH